MSKVSICIADRSLSRPLAEFAANSPTGGGISLRSYRSGDYLESFQMDGESTDIVTALEGCEVVGTASCTFRMCYAGDGQNQLKSALLGNFRIANRMRSTPTFGRMLKVVHQRCIAQGAECLLAVVQEDNLNALRIVHEQRPSLPKIRDEGRLFTLLIDPDKVRRKVAPSLSAGIVVRSGKPSDISNVLAFLNRWGATRAYFPVLDERDIGSGPGVGRLNICDFVLAFSNEKLIGTVAIWDQSAVRQWIVEGYSNVLKVARPIYNAYVRIAGGISLPPPGSAFRARFLAFFAPPPGNTLAAAALLREAAALKHDNRPLVIGMHEKDELLELLRPLASRVITSRVLSGRWNEGSKTVSSSSMPYVEVGSL